MTHPVEEGATLVRAIQADGYLRAATTRKPPKEAQPCTSAIRSNRLTRANCCGPQPATAFLPRPGGNAEAGRVSGLVRGKEITVMTAEAGPVTGYAPVTDLVMRARDGDQRAWDAIVERYAPLVWAICRRYRLAVADAEDAGQAVWLQLVDHIGQIRDPAALPGWLATTTGRECGRLVRAARRTCPPGQMLDAEDIPTSRPRGPTMSYWPRSGTRRCAMRSSTCRRRASG